MDIQMMIEHGYVPKTCTQEGGYVWGAVNVGHDPCGMCQHDREQCAGRPRFIDRQPKEDK